MEQYTFETAMARLEQIVRTLEEGKSTLEESLSVFEEGVRLVKLCTTALDGAEQKVKILLEDGNGGMAENDFGKAEGRS